MENTIQRVIPRHKRVGRWFVVCLVPERNMKMEQQQLDEILETVNSLVERVLPAGWEKTVRGVTFRVKELSPYTVELTYEKQHLLLVRPDM